jgi:hypothetical protein
VPGEGVTHGVTGHLRRHVLRVRCLVRVHLSVFAGRQSWGLKVVCWAVAWGEVATA